jgi:hypothetical protein
MRAVRSPAVIASFRLDLDELSALCLRRGLLGRQEVLAVGDEAHVVLSAELSGRELGATRADNVRSLVDGGDGSEWEGIACDGSGRVFVLRESTATVFVFAPDLLSLDRRVHLDLRADSIFDDPNAGPEGLVLLPQGRILVAKQRDPVSFVVFGPASPGPAVDGSTLTLLDSWRLSDEDEEKVESANDLAFDSRGRLHAISSKSRCIYRLGPLAAGRGRVDVEAGWKLPGEVEPGKKRRAEGLTFLDGDRALVALDSKDEGHNTYLLEALEDSAS